MGVIISNCPSRWHLTFRTYKELRHLNRGEKSPFSNVCHSLNAIDAFVKKKITSKTIQRVIHIQIYQKEIYK